MFLCISKQTIQIRSFLSMLRGSTKPVLNCTMRLQNVNPRTNAMLPAFLYAKKTFHSAHIKYNLPIHKRKSQSEMPENSVLYSIV
jgi:hypothetical protein